LGCWGFAPRRHREGRGLMILALAAE